MPKVKLPDGGTVDVPREATEDQVSAIVGEVMRQKAMRPEETPMTAGPTGVPQLLGMKPPSAESPFTSGVAGSLLRNVIGGGGETPAEAKSNLAVQGVLMGTSLIPGVAEMSIPARMMTMGFAGAGLEGARQLYLEANGVHYTPVEKQRAISGQGLVQGGLEGISGGLAALGGAIGRKITGSAADRAVLDTARKFDLPISAGEARGGVLKPLEKMTNYSILGSASSAQEKAVFLKKIQPAVEEVVGSLSPNKISQAQGGEVLKDAFGEARDKWDSVVTKVYDNLDRIAGNAKVVDVKQGGRKLINDLLAKETDLGLKFPGSMAHSNRFNEIAADFVNRPGGPLSFADAQALRSKYLWWQRNLPETDRDALPLIKRLVPMIDDAMATAAKKGGYETAWRAANQFYKDGIQVFNGEVIGRLMDRHPEKLVHDVGINEVTKMQDVYDALVKYGKTPEKFDEFRRLWIADKLRIPELNGEEPGIRVAKGLTYLDDQMKTAGADMSKRFFSDPAGREVRDNLSKLSEVVRRKGSLNAQDYAGWQAIRLTEGVIAAMVGMRHNLGEAAGTLLVLPTIQRILYSKAATNTLVRGLDNFPVAGKGLRYVAPSALSNLTRAVSSAYRMVSAGDQPSPPAPAQ